GHERGIEPIPNSALCHPWTIEQDASGIERSGVVARGSSRGAAGRISAVARRLQSRPAGGVGSALGLPNKAWESGLGGGAGGPHARLDLRGVQRSSGEFVGSAGFGYGGADEEVLRGDVGRETNEASRGAAGGASRYVEAETLAIALLLGGIYAVRRMVTSSGNHVRFDLNRFAKPVWRRSPYQSVCDRTRMTRIAADRRRSFLVLSAMIRARQRHQRSIDAFFAANTIC